VLSSAVACTVIYYGLNRKIKKKDSYKLFINEININEFVNLNISYSWLFFTLNSILIVITTIIIIIIVPE